MNEVATGANGRVVDQRTGNQVRVVLPSVPVREASLAGLQEQMRSASRAKAQAEAIRARAAAEYSRRLGDKATEKELRKQSRQSARGTRTEVKVATQLKDLPNTKNAFETGEITFGHAKVIAATAERAKNIDEQELVGRAKVEPVDVFSRTARRHEQQRSHDDGIGMLEAQKRARRAWIKTDRDDGMTVLYARFDPITGARIRNALSHRTDQLWREEHPNHRPSTEQRLADAVADLICRPDRTQEKKGKPGWAGATLFITANYDVVTQKLQDAQLADGTPIPVETIKELACEAEIVPAFFDSRSQPLWVGTSSRLATRAQRMALFARDRGCVGCQTDPEWCQAHHIIPWQEDGPTNIDNLVLLCSRCHHQIHDNRWQIHQTPDGKHVMLPPPRHRPPPPNNHPRRRRRRRKLTTQLRR